LISIIDQPNVTKQMVMDFYIDLLKTQIIRLQDWEALEFSKFLVKERIEKEFLMWLIGRLVRLSLFLLFLFYFS